MDIKDLTLKEKASLLVGYKTMSTFPIIEKDIPSINLSDGPNGVRKEDVNGDSLTGIGNTLPSTCFPVEATLASSWNKDLAFDMGVALGKECIDMDIDVLLGPAINIKRNPLCGRNFEYLSEDPFLTGKIGANLVKGIQSKNVGACLKHFACNNNEKYRMYGDSIVDLKALYEIYLKPFEMVIKEAHPYAIMSAYNKINGVFASENEYLLKNVLRNNWGFDGLVMTDWGGMVNRDISLINGCDLEMPGMINHNIQLIVDGVKNGLIPEEVLNQSVQRLLDLKNKTNNKVKDEFSYKDHYSLALKIAIEGAVLLKNDKKALPLDKNEKILVVGGLFTSMRYQGSGSSLLNPAIIKNHKNAFKSYDVSYDFVLGYEANEFDINEKLEKAALEVANNYETIVFYGGLNDYVESEGYDRDDMSMPKNQLSLLEKLTKLNKKIIVVLFTGSPIELPFINEVDAVLNMVLPGEAGGEATTRLLLGLDSPSGKLTESWPITYTDVPFSNEFTSNPNELYKESIFVGYRYYQSVNKEVLFPFGYGLSYTDFSLSNLNTKLENNRATLTFKAKNNGFATGKVVVQAYISKPDSKIVRPRLELKGFVKEELKIGEEKELQIDINIDDLAVYFDNEFKIEKGKYLIELGFSCLDIKLKTEINIDGESLAPSEYDDIYHEFLSSGLMDKQMFEKVIGRAIPAYIVSKKPYTLETPISEYQTFFGKLFRKIACGVGMKQYKKALKIKDPLLREREKKTGLFFNRIIPNNSLRSLCFSSSGKLKYNTALGLLEIINGHLFKGLATMMKKDKIKE